MRIPAINLLKNWRALVLIAITPALANCSRIDGSIELHNSNGEPYSFAGAQVDVFDMDRNAAIAGETKTRKGRGSVDTDGESISLQVITATIDDSALYDVEIRCPANNAADACNVESPLHVVLTGSQLKASGWRATALTELAFQNIAYYVAAAYSTVEIAQVLDNTANALLIAKPPTTTSTYDDVIAWRTSSTDAVKRPGLLNTISESLAAGVGNNDIKLLARKSVNPYVTTVDLSAQWTSDASIKYVTVDGDYAYLAGDGEGLGIVDISNPELPVAAGYSSQVSATTSAVVDGNFVYVAGDQGLQIVDVSNPQLPRVAGQLAVDGGIRKLLLSAGHAFVATETALRIIDISDPASPVLVGSHEGTALYMTISGTTAYLIDFDYDLQIVDISNPVAPATLGTMGLESITSAIAAFGDYVYLTFETEPFSGPGGLQVIDVSNAAEPTYAGPQLNLTPDGSEIVLSGNKLYVATFDSVQVIDVSNAEAPVLLAKMGLQLDDFGDNSIAVSDKFVFITTERHDLSVADLSIAVQPVVRSGELALADSARGNLSLLGNYAYLQNTNFLREEESVDSYDFSNPVVPAPLSGLYYIDDLATTNTSGGYAFALDSFDSAVRVVNVSDPGAPFVLDDAYLQLDDGHTVSQLAINDIVMSGDHVYIPWGDYRRGDDNDVLGCTNADSEGGVGGLFAVDVSTPQAPALAGHVCVTERAEAVAVNGNYAYVAVADGLLQLIDISDPAQPTLAGATNLSAAVLSAPVKSIAVNGNYVWAAEGSNGIGIINVSDANAPVLVTNIDTPGFVSSITFDERYAYVADGTSGVLVFDITTPALPALIGGASTQGKAFSVFLAGGYLQAATGFGFETFRVMPQVSN